MRWLTDGLPWRFIDLRRGYFRTLRIAKACPEIKGEINRHGFLLLAMLAVYVPALILISPFLVMRLVSDIVLDIAWRPPDFYAMQAEANREALAKVPRDEIKRRIGEPVSRILAKREEARKAK